MSFETFTVALSSKDFPFVSDFLTRSVVIPSIDGPPRIPHSLVGELENVNPELAQHYYVQNVLPTAEGLASVGYGQIVAANLGSTDFDRCITLRDAAENNFLLVPAAGKNYVYTANTGAWNSLSPFVFAGNNVTRSYVNGRTLVCYSHNKIVEYDTATGTLLDRVPTRILSTDIDCIGSSNNYNIAVTGINVNWSSLIDPLDFVPSRQTGSSFAIPQDMKGIGVAVIPISGGFVIYTTKNAVLALYTNNATAPFVFREIANVGGIVDSSQVTADAASGYHYAWTSNGLQKISVTGAENLSAAASDFFSGRIWEEFNLTNLTFTLQRLNADPAVKIAFISGRFVVISYGKVTIAPQLYTHALVYDTALKRWGKLRVDHTDCFSYPYPNFIGFTSSAPPKQSLAFLKSSGQIDLLIMDYRERADQGVLLLGRFQLVRQKMATFQKVELEGLHQAYPPNVYLILSPDGKTNLAPKQLQIITDAGNFKTYGAPDPVGTQAAARTGKNFSNLITGSFELTTATITLTRHGSR